MAKSCKQTISSPAEHYVTLRRRRVTKSANIENVMSPATPTYEAALVGQFDIHLDSSPAKGIIRLCDKEHLRNYAAIVHKTFT